MRDEEKKPEKPGKKPEKKLDGKETGKKGRLLPVICTAAVLMAAGSGCFLWYTWKELEEQEMPQDFPSIGMEPGSGIVSAGGSTSVGMQEERFDLTFIETELEIEEVYLSSQDEVEAHTAILKLTDESVEAARRELEEKAVQTGLDYREALLDGEEARITARQTLDTSILNGAYADHTYEEALKENETEIKELQEQIEEAQELVDEYTASAETDYYYTYYEVEAKKEALDQTFSVLMQLYEEWNVSELQDHSQTASAGSAGGVETAGVSGGMPGGGVSVSNDSTKLTVYDMLDQETAENEAAYEQALEEYEDAKSMAAASLPQAQAQLELLKTQLEEAQIAYEKQQVDSQSSREAALSESGQAQETYQRELDRIEDEISVALNNKEEAEENLQEFEETLGDGCLYTTDGGTVMMVNVREDAGLTGGSMVLAYSRPDQVTVTASVDQEDIASIQIGGKAAVMVSEQGLYDGKVSSINPVSSSSSRSSVTYSVVIELTGDVSSLSQNLSATVYFGLSASELQTKEPEPQSPEQKEAAR